MIDFGGFAIFVDAKNADIEIVTRVFEIIRVAAIKGHLLFRRENDPYVVVTLVAVEMVDTALIKSHDIGAESRSVFAFFFNPRDGLFARLASSVGGHSAFQRAVHLR